MVRKKTTKKKTGRPNHKGNTGGTAWKLTPEVKKALLKYIREGMSRSDSASLCGISYETVRRHAREDVEFMESLRQAEIEFKHKHVKYIGEDDSFQARKWLLACKFPKEFAEKQRLVHEGDKENPITTIDLTNMSPKELKELLAQLPDDEEEEENDG